VFVVATVEGTLIHGMPAAFAGFRSNVGLGRSVSSVRGSFPCKRSHRRQQVPSGRRGGERRQHAQSACTLRGDAQKALSTLEDASFARSRDPCTSIATKFTCARCKPRSDVVARSLRYRGRANLRKQEEPAPGSKRADGARLAACHRFSSEKVVRDASEKEGGHGLRPREETRAPVGVRTSW